MAWQLDDVQCHACRRRRHATCSPYLRIHRYHHLHPSHHRPSHSAPSSTKPTALANDTTTTTPTPTPQLPISKVTRRSHHLPHVLSVTSRRWIMPITEEAQEKHKEPRGVALQRNHRRNSSLMGGPSTDFACRVFPLILLACERKVGCTDVLPV